MTGVDSASRWEMVRIIPLTPALLWVETYDGGHCGSAFVSACLVPRADVGLSFVKNGTSHPAQHYPTGSVAI